MADIKRNYSENIRTIAKTPEIQEKLDKLIQAQSDAKKSKIDSVRASSTSTATGTQSTSSENATTNTGAGLDLVYQIYYSSSNYNGPNTSPGPNTTGLTDAGTTSQINNNVDISSSNNPNKSDMTDSAHPTTNNGGGSVFAKQALLGENDSNWQTIKNAMTDNGATDSEIAEARRKFLRQELGIDEIGDVFTGYAGAKPADNSDAIGGLGISNGPTAVPKEKQIGLVGTDPNDNTKALLVRLDGYQPTPSNTDAAAGGQNPWLNGLPPIKKSWNNWVQGFIWTNTGNIITADGFDTMSFPTVEVAADTLKALPTFNIDETTYCPTAPPNTTVITSVDILSFETSLSDIIVHTAAHTYFCPNGATGTFDQQPVFSKSVCVPGSSDECPISAPLEEFFPITGLGTISYRDGKFTASQYDSEVPLIYQTPTSTAVLHSNSTGEDYKIEPAINGGFMISQSIDTPYILVYASDGTLQTIVSPALKIFYSPRSF